MIRGAVRLGWSSLVGVGLRLTRTRASRLRALDLSPFRDSIATISPERERRIDGLLTGGTIARVQALMDEGELSSQELTLFLLARIGRLDPTLQSIIELNPDAGSEADAADARRRAGAWRGALDGIPVTVKDNIETTGPMRTTAGSMALADHIAARDAAVSPLCGRPAPSSSARRTSPSWLAPWLGPRG